ncbi:MAG TPA: glycerophosphodiester phosphodiesterase family protein [Polyangium sp.]|nr:glycerophosphodiester phosphodiesterase family protein [Polyangium sp.]
MSRLGLGLDVFRRRAGRRPWVYGHRGSSGAPENTLAAFEKAARDGADGIELDVRLSADGELVVMHDATFERVTAGRDHRHVAELPYEEIRRIDLGDGQVAPRLSEVLRWARARHMRVNVEMKHGVPQRLPLAHATARQLDAVDPFLPIIVSSFDPLILATFATLLPRVPRALLVHRSKWSTLALETGQVWRDGLHVERTLTRDAVIQRLLRRKLLLNVWTVNDLREATDLAEMGVDGIITDVPGLVRANFSD